MLKYNNKTIYSLLNGNTNINKLMYGGRNVFQRVEGQSGEDDGLLLNVTWDKNGMVFSGKDKDNHEKIQVDTEQQPCDYGYSWMGVTKNHAKSFYGLYYDSDDLVGTAFQDSFTIETLMLIDNVRALGSNGNASTGIFTTKLVSTEQSGGWGFENYPSLNKGLLFSVGISNDDGETMTWCPTSINKNLINLGQFYHLVGTVDNVNKTVKLYVNGELYGESSYEGNPVLPNIGTTLKEKDLYLFIGGDPCSLNVTTQCESSVPTTSIYMNIYNKSKSLSEVQEMYTDDVKKFTEVETPEYYDLLKPDSLNYIQKQKLLGSDSMTIEMYGSLNWDNISNLTGTQTLVTTGNSGTYYFGNCIQMLNTGQLQFRATYCGYSTKKCSGQSYNINMTKIDIKQDGDDNDTKYHIVMICQGNLGTGFTYVWINGSYIRMSQTSVYDFQKTYRGVNMNSQYLDGVIYTDYFTPKKVRIYSGVMDVNTLYENRDN